METNESAARNRLLADLERTLNFDYHSGDAFVVHPPHSMHWRVLPYALTAQTDYPAALIVNGQKILSRGGDAIFVQQSCRHHVSLVGNVAGYSRFSHFNALIFGSISALALFEIPSCLRGQPAARIGEINTQLAALNTANADVQRAIARKTLGFALIRTLIESGQPTQAGPVTLESLQRLAPVLGYIRDRLTEPISLADLARVMHLSESRFHAVFKEITGDAPLFYVQRMRLQTAQQLLIETDQPIKEVSARAGHADVFHFSRLFRKRFGMSPSLYRTKARESLGLH